MKTEAQIKQTIEDAKDNLVNASGDGVVMTQGFIRALQWVLAEEVKE